MLALMLRTLPSISRACIELWEVEGMVLLHDDVVAGLGLGMTWNLDVVPRFCQVLNRGSQAGFHSPCPHSVPDPLHRAYFSATPIVLEVPSGKLAGIRAKTPELLF